MTKIKRWVLVLSSVTIGSLRSSGFAAWKISNSIKNGTSFDVDADGDVTEAESSFVKINRVDLLSLGIMVSKGMVSILLTLGMSLAIVILLGIRLFQWVL